MRRLAAGAAFALVSCGSPAAVPPAPPRAVEVRAPDDLVIAASAIQDLQAEVGRARLPAAPRERYFKLPEDMAADAVTTWYGARLTGWRPAIAFPRRTRGGPSAAWTANGRTFALVLISDPDQRTLERGPEQLLITLGPH